MIPDSTDKPTVQDDVAAFAGLLSAERGESKDDRETPEPETSEPETADTQAPEEDETDAAASDESEGETAEDDAAGDEPTEPEPTKTFTVKIDGKDESVTLDELLKGYSRTADYTRKTQALADERKAVDGVKAERAQYATLLAQLQTALESTKPAEPDWEKLRVENPAEYAATWVEWDRYQKQIATIAAERQLAEQRVAQDQADSFRGTLQAEHDRLIEAVPDWKDTAKAKAQKAELFDYAKTLGYSDDDIAQVVDHRAIVVLRKAMLFDKAAKAAPAIKARIEQVKTATPGAKKSASVSVEKRAAQRLAQTGKASDAIPLFLAEIRRDKRPNK